MRRICFEKLEVLLRQSLNGRRQPFETSPELWRRAMHLEW